MYSSTYCQTDDTIYNGFSETNARLICLEPNPFYKTDPFWLGIFQNITLNIPSGTEAYLSFDDWNNSQLNVFAMRAWVGYTISHVLIPAYSKDSILGSEKALLKYQMPTKIVEQAVKTVLKLMPTSVCWLHSKYKLFSSVE